MNSTDYKLDAILRCLNFYYSKFAYSTEVYRHTGDESDHTNEFVDAGLISAWLDFSENETINLNRAELTDLLNHLEIQKLIISDIISGERQFKILPEGISLIEKSGYVKKQNKLDREYKVKIKSFWISIAAFILSFLTFIYTVFIKK